MMTTRWARLMGWSSLAVAVVGGSVLGIGAIIQGMNISKAQREGHVPVAHVMCRELVDEDVSEITTYGTGAIYYYDMNGVEKRAFGACLITLYPEKK